MNSKAGPVTEQASNNQGLRPKLRFPEFRDAGEWVEKPLGEFASLISERVGKREFIPLSITSGVGLVSQEEKFGRTIAGQQLKNYLVLRKGDFAYNKSATKLYPQGYAAMYQGDEIGCVPSSIFTCFSVTDKSVAKTYINYQLSANLHGRWLSRFTTIGARANGSLNVDDHDLLALPVPLPEGPAKFAEQQKIAECLSSLDALIAVETDKLAALRDHKKGLMQHLFPSEGETTPRLRFPEFLNAGGWEERPLGEIATYQNGKAYEPHIVEAGRYIVVNARFISTDGLVKKWSNNPLLIAAKDDILMVLSDLPNGKALAKCCRVAEDEKYAVNQRIARLTPHGVRSDFLFPVLNRHPYLLAFNDGMNQTHLSKDNVLTCPILLPSDEEEQIAIADCIASLELKITAQSDRLGVLKAHKLGLMQQLFPSLDETAA